MNNDNDLYLWLESLSNKEIINWVDEKTKITERYLNAIPYRDNTRKVVEYFCNQPKYEIGISNVCVHGNNLYFLKNPGFENVSKLYSMDIDTGLETLLVDPLKISDSDNTHIYLVSISNDGKYVGFTLNKSGSDWCELRVVNTKNALVLPDVIEWAKISSLEFFEDGFFYSAYEEHPTGEETTSIPKGHKLCYHRLGTDTSQDEIVLDKNSVIESTSLDNTSVIWGTLLDGRYLVARCVFSSNVAWVCKDLSDKENKFKQLLETQKNDQISLVGSIGGKVYFLSFGNASNGQIVSIDLSSNEKNELKTVIASDKRAIKSASCNCGKIFVAYLDDVKTTIKQFNRFGQFEHDIKLPFMCTARTSSGSITNKFSVAQIESFFIPKALYKIDLNTGNTTPIFPSKNLINSNDYEIRQVFYKSFDDTKIPMFVIGKKGNIQDFKRPLILSGYGAANVSNTPYYSYLALSLIENGGVYAVANIRGGGEYGFDWYKAGIKENRMNCFKDFICAAEYLISEGYTSKEQLAIYGGSNGGTMVAACMNMRPDLFKVVIANSGLFDMLRFHKIGFGSAWISEYGDPQSKHDWEYLRMYSPIHNVRSEFAYPAVLVPVCEKDDRVSPVHSYKLIEAFAQNSIHGGPFLLRVQKDAGHGLRKISSQIDEFADILSFVLWHVKKS